MSPITVAGKRASSPEPRVAVRWRGLVDSATRQQGPPLKREKEERQGRWDGQETTRCRCSGGQTRRLG